ncbi:MAG: Hsp20/alpha crystallin family protein [bacterium]
MKYEIMTPNRRRSLVDTFFEGDLLNDFFAPATRDLGGLTDWIPEVGILEKGNKYVIKADLPGVEEKDVSLEVKDGILTLKGERRNEAEKEEGNVYSCERSYGSFMRSFDLGDVKEEDIKAEYKNGTLTIELPKTEERKAKKIEIKH